MASDSQSITGHDPIARDALEAIQQRVSGVSTEAIEKVLWAAEDEFDTAFTRDTPICCDCMKAAVPGCDYFGHGVVSLAELIDSYITPEATDGAQGCSHWPGQTTCMVCGMGRENEKGPWYA